MFFLTSAMKTLKTTVNGKTDQVTPQWIEVKVSHLMNAYFRIIMLCNLVIVRFKFFFMLNLEPC